MKDKYRVDVCLGIRPDAIRTSVLLKKLKAHPRISLRIIWTNQHFQDSLRDVFFEEMDIPRPDNFLDGGSGSHWSQHSRVIDGLGKLLEVDRPDCILFLGDANVVVGAIAPYKMGIPILHVEAGNRSYDANMPEERNRIIVDRISDVCYTYSEWSTVRLVREGINPSKVLTVGNVIVDVLQHYEGKVDTAAAVAKFSLPSRFALMTLHRDGNMSAERVDAIMNGVGWWARSRGMPVILPVMPRLRLLIEGKNYPGDFRFVEPMGFFDFISLERAATIEFTDSGTNQETASLHKTPCVVLRPNTERPETFASNIVILADTKAGDAAENVLKRKYAEGYTLGDGNASQRILDDMLRRLDRNFDKQAPPWQDNFIKQHMVDDSQLELKYE